MLNNILVAPASKSENKTRQNEAATVDGNRPLAPRANRKLGRKSALSRCGDKKRPKPRSVRKMIVVRICKLNRSRAEGKLSIR